MRCRCLSFQINAVASVIEIEDVLKTWSSTDRQFCLDVPEFRIEAGQTAFLSGENGTGKTTFLELLGLATRPDSGKISLSANDLGTNVSDLWHQMRLGELSRLRAETFGYVLQSVHLLPFLTIRQNAELTQQASGRLDSAHLNRLIDALGLQGCERMLPEKLSPGLRQRAAVARALAHRPQFVLADEPTASLDPEGGDVVLELLRDLARNDGAAIVMSLHHRSLPEGDGIIRFETRRVATEQPNVFHAILAAVSS